MLKKNGTIKINDTVRTTTKYYSTYFSSNCENIFQKLHNRINVAQEGKEWKLAEILSSG